MAISIAKGWVSSGFPFSISRGCPLERLSISRGVSSGVFSFPRGDPLEFLLISVERNPLDSLSISNEWVSFGILSISKGGSSAFPFNFKRGKVCSSGLRFNLGGMKAPLDVLQIFKGEVGLNSNGRVMNVGPLDFVSISKGEA